MGCNESIPIFYIFFYIAPLSLIQKIAATLSVNGKEELYIPDPYLPRDSWSIELKLTFKNLPGILLSVNYKIYL